MKAQETTGERPACEQAPQPIGIDVSQAALDVAEAAHGAVTRYSNDPTGIKRLVRKLRTIPGVLAVLEATGGYEQPLLQALWAADIRVARVHPKRVRDFARASGRYAKTDPLDARMLVRFAQVMKPTPITKPSQAQHDLKARSRRREQLVRMRGDEAKRRKQCHDPDIAGAIDAHIEWLDEQIAELEAEVAEIQKQEPCLRQAGLRLRSVPGVGPVVSTALLAEMPSLGDPNVSPKQLAALAGLAPFNADSGKQHKARRIHGGRGRPRRYLYNAALVATRFNPPIRDFYLRLLQRGCAKKAAIIACARKLLTILHAILKNQTYWNIQQL